MLQKKVLANTAISKKNHQIMQHVTRQVKTLITRTTTVYFRFIAKNTAITIRNL